MTESPWSGVVLDFYEAAARCCGGDEEAKDEIEQGVSEALSRSRGDSSLMDDARRERDQTEFEPKGEWGTAG